MTPGDPTESLPCDDALQGLIALRAEAEEMWGAFAANVDRRIESLKRCRLRCRVGGRTGEEAGL
jgi:hypothetical protein